MKRKYEVEKYPDEIAEILYNLSEDMDAQDYEEEKEKEIAELEEALYQLRAMAQNEYNKDYWRTLWNALQNL